MKLLGHTLSVFSTLVDVVKVFYSVVVPFTCSPAIYEMFCCDKSSCVKMVTCWAQFCISVTTVRLNVFF